MKYQNLCLIAVVCIITACQNKPDSISVEMQPPPEPVEASKSADTIAPPVPVIANTGDDKLYNFIGMENPPTYPGGMQALYEFLGKNIKYPKEASEKNVQGNVFLSFTVGKDGGVKDVKVDKKLGSGTDEEAVRVLKMSKKWNPGTQDGKPVNVKYNIPIKFALTK
ncbi:MAG: energy transducer TonB [Chitinophagaceae bacterium]|nr:MAG: energy transducer TonB [Chitinophagaceae bacterium]